MPGDADLAGFSEPERNRKEGSDECDFNNGKEDETGEGSVYIRSS